VTDGYQRKPAPKRGYSDRYGPPRHYSVGVSSSPPLNPIAYLERNAQAAPAGAFVKTPKQTITNSEALVNVKKIAYELRRLGVKRGDMLALDLPELLGILFIEAVYHEAAARTFLPPGYDPAGAFPIDWLFSTKADAVAPAGARLVIVDARFLEQVEQNPYGITARDFESGNSLTSVVYSSGTTGTPKAIPAYVELVDRSAAAMIDPWVARSDILSFLPAKTPLGLFAFYTNGMKGIPYLDIGDNVPAETVSLIASTGVSTLVMSPAQVAAFVGELETTGRTLPQIDTVYTVGMAMPASLSARLRNATDGCAVLCIYGSTEAFTIARRDYETDDPFDVGIIDRPEDLQIVDEHGALLPDGEVGLIRYRSPYMAHEYLGDPVGTAAAFRDGWFYPGDLGSIRPGNGLTLAGRTAELINAGGVKVDPMRLDFFAARQAGVLDAASFGYETADGILQVGIALVTGDGVDVQNLIREFEAEFGPAAPRLVARVDSIPRNAMGKPVRRTLAERYTESRPTSS
jgi:long-chain acyl-CoA synthetase